MRGESTLTCGDESDEWGDRPLMGENVSCSVPAASSTDDECCAVTVRDDDDVGWR